MTSWTSTNLGSVCQFKGGVAFPKDLQGHVLGEVPFIKVGDMDMDGNKFFVRNSRNWLSNATVVQLRARPFQAGTCVFAKIGEAIHANRVRILSRPTLIDNNMMAAIPANGISSRFLAYLLEFLEPSSFAEGTALPYLNAGDLARAPVELPPPKQRESIAAILGALDDKIDLNRQMNRTLEEMASALFKSWFIDFDPVTAKLEGRQPFDMDVATAALFPAEFEETPEGPVPKGWQIRNLDEIAEFLNGLALQNFRPKVGEASLPVIKIADLRAGRPSGSEEATANIPKQYIVEDGDVIFSWSGSLMVDVWCGGRGALNQHLFKVTPIGLPNWLPMHWVHVHLPDFQGIAADKATTMGHIRRHHLSDAKVVLPPAAIIAAANKNMSVWLELTVANRVESRTLTALRDLLLPQLLSGEIRIKDAEKLVEAAA